MKLKVAGLNIDTEGKTVWCWISQSNPSSPTLRIRLNGKDDDGDEQTTCIEYNIQDFLDILNGKEIQTFTNKQSEIENYKKQIKETNK